MVGARPDPTGERRRSWAVWLGIAGLLLALGAPMLCGRVYINPDLNDYYLPYKQFYAQSLQSGDGLVWCPSLFNGFYLHGEGQLGLFHPFHLLAYRWLPLTLAFNLECWLPYPLMALGFFLLMRRQGLPRDAAGLGAAAFAFCGFNLLHFLHMNPIVSVVHIPWLLLAQDTLARTPDRRTAVRAGVAVMLLTVSLLFLGFPQVVFFSTLAELFYWLIAWPSSKGRIAWWVMWKTAGVLGGGVQLVPMWESARLSVRAEPGAAFLCSWSLPPANLGQLVAPYVFGKRFFQITEGNVHEFGAYAGAGTLALAAWAWARRRELPHPRTVALLLAWTGFALLMSLGSYGYLYRLQTLLPFVSSFRCPCRYLLLVHFGLAWLAAIGYADVSRGLSDRRGWLALAAVLAAAGLMAGLGLAAGRSFQAAAPLAVIGGFCIVALFVAMVAWSAHGSRGALLLLPLLACVDMGVYGLSYHYQLVTPQTIAQFRMRITRPEGDTPPGARVAGLENLAILCGWRATDGYAGLTPRRRLDYTAVPALRLSGATALATVNRSGPVPEVKGWRTVPNPLPRVRLLTRAQVSSRPEADCERVELETTALVEEDLRLLPGPPGRAELLGERNGRMVIETQAESRQLLVVADSFHPGWQAHIDGQPARVLRVNGDFLGCVVPPDRHRVEFDFRPASLRHGLYATAAGGGLGLLLTVLGLAGARGRTSSGSPRPPAG